ncbi:Translation Initiation factor eIF- 4e-like protein [Raphanus sativus]|nr:Translation Initiation factor eIF- 4e-like protein [Raphanus sativus]
MNANTLTSSMLVCIILYGTSLRFGTHVAHQGSGTRHLTRTSSRRLLNSARLKVFGHATDTLLALLVQVIFISSRMAFAHVGGKANFLVNFSLAVFVFVRMWIIIDIANISLNKTKVAKIHFNQDGANCNGGKWIIRFSKGVSARFWEDLLLALVGDQLDDADNICGAVLSVPFNEASLVCGIAMLLIIRQ